MILPMRVLVYFLGSSLCFAPALADDGISLAPRFEAGTRLHYVSRSVIRHEISADLLETKETVVVRTESGMSLVVAEVASNGEADILWTQHYLVLTTDGAMPGIEQALDYDSRKPGAGASPLGPTMAALLAKPIPVRVSRGGDVLAFTAPQVNAHNDVVGQLAASMFSEEAFRQLPLFITSGAPVSVNVRGTWSQHQRIALPLGDTALELRQAFTFLRKRPRRQSAQLSMQGSIAAATAGPGAAAGMAALQDATLNVESGKTSGTYEWDYAHGRLLSAETALDLVTQLDTRVGRMRLEQHLAGSIDLVDERQFERKSRSLIRTPERGDR